MPLNGKEREMIRKAVPEVFSDGKIDIQNNYVEFPIPLPVFKQIRKWLDDQDKDFEIVTGCRDKFHPYENVKLLILNRRQQRIYQARGSR